MLEITRHRGRSHTGAQALARSGDVGVIVRLLGGGVERGGGDENVAP